MIVLFPGVNISQSLGLIGFWGRNYVCCFSFFVLLTASVLFLLISLVVAPFLILAQLSSNSNIKPGLKMVVSAKCTGTDAATGIFTGNCLDMNPVSPKEKSRKCTRKVM